MRKFINKRTVSLSLLIIVMFVSMKGLATDFNNKAIKEKTNWIMENVPAEEFKGKTDVKARDSGWIYSSIHTTYISNYSHTLGRLEGQVRWRSDFNQNVTNYGPYVHKNIVMGSLVISNKSYDGYLANNNNARLTLQADFIDYSDVYSAIQVYNVRGDGTYEYREF